MLHIAKTIVHACHAVNLLQLVTHLARQILQHTQITSPDLDGHTGTIQHAHVHHLGIDIYITVQIFCRIQDLLLDILIGNGGVILQHDIHRYFRTCISAAGAAVAHADTAHAGQHRTGTGHGTDGLDVIHTFQICH